MSDLSHVLTENLMIGARFAHSRADSAQVELIMAELRARDQALGTNDADVLKAMLVRDTKRLDYQDAGPEATPSALDDLPKLSVKALLSMARSYHQRGQTTVVDRIVDELQDRDRVVGTDHADTLLRDLGRTVGTRPAGPPDQAAAGQDDADDGTYQPKPKINPPPDPALVQRDLEQARERLLDLSYRNRLINCPAAKASGKRRAADALEFIGSLDRVWKVLAEQDDGKSVVQTYDLDEQNRIVSGVRRRTRQEPLRPAAPRAGDRQLSLFEDRALADPDRSEVPRGSGSADAEDLAEAFAAHLGRGGLVASVPHEVAMRRLDSIYKKQNLLIESTGDSALFLAFGILTWPDGGARSRAADSPLLLIHVELERETPAGGGERRYHVSASGDGVQSNPALIAKMQRDYKITLPPYDEETYPTCDAYGRAVMRALQRLPGCSVQYQLLLGFFNFAKYRMYLDLDPKTWPEGQKPAAHPLVASLVRQQSLYVAGTAPLPSEKAVSQRQRTEDMPVVLDADATQYASLMAAHAGVNLVIRGPPGTGKSQTITNLIACLVAANKTVLFAAQKTTALNVVFEHLVEAGLEHACLPFYPREVAKTDNEGAAAGVSHRVASPLEISQVLKRSCEWRKRAAGRIEDAGAGVWAEHLDTRQRALASPAHDFPSVAALLQTAAAAVGAAERRWGGAWKSGLLAVSTVPKETDPAWWTERETVLRRIADLRGQISPVWDGWDLASIQPVHLEPAGRTLHAVATALAAAADACASIDATLIDLTPDVVARHLGAADRALPEPLLPALAASAAGDAGLPGALASLHHQMVEYAAMLAAASGVVRVVDQDPAAVSRLAETLSQALASITSAVSPATTLSGVQVACHHLASLDAHAALFRNRCAQQSDCHAVLGDLTFQVVQQLGAQRPLPDPPATFLPALALHGCGEVGRLRDIELLAQEVTNLARLESVRDGLPWSAALLPPAVQSTATASSAALVEAGCGSVVLAHLLQLSERISGRVGQAQKLEEVARRLPLGVAAAHLIARARCIRAALAPALEPLQTASAAALDDPLLRLLAGGTVTPACARGIPAMQRAVAEAKAVVQAAVDRCEPPPDPTGPLATALVEAWHNLPGHMQNARQTMEAWSAFSDRLGQVIGGLANQSSLAQQVADLLGLPGPQSLNDVSDLHAVAQAVDPPAGVERSAAATAVAARPDVVQRLDEEILRIEDTRRSLAILRNQMQVDRITDPEQVAAWHRAWVHHRPSMVRWFRSEWRTARDGLRTLFGRPMDGGDLPKLIAALRAARARLALTTAPPDLASLLGPMWRGIDTAVADIQRVREWCVRAQALASRPGLTVARVMQHACHPDVARFRDGGWPALSDLAQQVWADLNRASRPTGMSPKRMQRSLEQAALVVTAVTDAATDAGVHPEAPLGDVALGFDHRTRVYADVAALEAIPAPDAEHPWSGYAPDRIVATVAWYEQALTDGLAPDHVARLATPGGWECARELLAAATALLGPPATGTDATLDPAVEAILAVTPVQDCGQHLRRLIDVARALGDDTAAVPARQTVTVTVLADILGNAADIAAANRALAPWRDICQRPLCGADVDGVSATRDWLQEARGADIPAPALAWVVSDPQGMLHRANWYQLTAAAARAVTGSWRAAVDSGLTPGPEMAADALIAPWHDGLHARLDIWRAAHHTLVCEALPETDPTLRVLAHGLGRLEHAGDIATSLEGWTQRLGVPALSLTPDCIDAHRQWIEAIRASDPRVRRHIFSADPARAVAACREGSVALDSLRVARATLRTEWSAMATWRDEQGPHHLDDRSLRLGDLRTRVQEATDALPRLRASADFARATKDAATLGLTRLVAAAGGQADAEVLTLGLAAAARERQAERVLAQHPVLRNGSTTIYPDQAQSYRTAVRRMLRINRQRVINVAARRHVDPGYEGQRAADRTGLVLLEKEWSKQTRRIPIRRLVERGGAAMRGLAPVWLMTPLAVAQFLGTGAPVFDVVVMDEASQLDPEDAIGAILRGRQTVIVGDPKQMPPSDLFSSSADSDDDGDSEDEDDAANSGVRLESILDMGLKSFPECQLQWHYRSKHERLIAPANALSYENQLILFPAAQRPSEHLGILYHRVLDGVFTPKANINEAEARAVVDRVVRLLRDHAGVEPDKAPSIGVVTMNLKQQQHIDQMLYDRCQDDPVLEELYRRQADMRSHERLTIKNLENFQGDQRDVMILAMTYGPDVPGGRVHQHFKSIGGESGHRRFNVLITRAKLRMEIFASFDSSHVTPSTTEGALGRAHLKQFLAYCEAGCDTRVFPDFGHTTDRGSDSPFEDEVALFLRGQGYAVDHNVGVAGYFIDLAIHHPNDAGRYAIGIECDGARYHSTKTARDRDKNRQEVLELRGWCIHRVWSTDWFQDRLATQQHLLRAVRRAIG